LDKKGRKFSNKRSVLKDIREHLDRRTGIGAKELPRGGHDNAGWQRDFEHLELNTIDKHANEDSRILSSNMHYKNV